MSKHKHNRERERAYQRALQEAERIRLLNAVPVPAENQEEPPEAPDHNRQSEEEKPMGMRESLKPSSFTDYCLAVFTGLLVVVAIWQIAITKGQLGAMRNDQRAWLKVDLQPSTSGGDHTIVTITVGQPVTYPFQITNIGKTAARNIDAKIFSAITYANQEPPLDHVMQASKYAHNHVTAGIVFPSDILKQIGERPGNEGASMPATEAEVEVIQEGKGYLAVFGIVDYDDVFDVHHWTKFCIWISKTGTFQTEGCTKFNDVLRIPVKWAADSGDVGQGRSEATLVVFLP
jgi:hypothetical protein